MKPEEKLKKNISNLLKPNGNIDVSTFLKKEAFLPEGNNLKSKTINLDLNPWFKEIIEEIIKNPTLKEVNIMAPIGSGKTTAILALIYASLLLKPRQVLLVGPSETITMDILGLFIKPALKKNKKIKAIWPLKDMDRKESIHFPTMSIFTGSSTAIRTLQNRSVDLVVNDEAWLFENLTLDYARGRLHDRNGARMVNVSQGGLKGSPWELTYNQGLIKEYSWKCPCCNEYNPYKFNDLKFTNDEDDDGKPIYKSVVAELECPKCEHRIEDTIENRRSLSENAKYVVENPDQNCLPDRISYNFNQLAVYYVSWADIVRQFLVANNSIDKANLLKNFFQQKMAQHWDASMSSEEVDMTQNTMEYSMDQYKNDPWDVRIITADVQGELIWVCIRDWTREGRSRLVNYTYCTKFSELENLRMEYNVKTKAVLVDAAHRSEEVKVAAAQYGWLCVNGREDRLFTITDKGKSFQRVYSQPKTIETKTQSGKKVTQLVYYAGTSVKDILTTLMKNGDNWQIPSNGLNFDKYYHQVNGSEERRIDRKSGKAYYHKVKDQNHAFDCEVEQVIGALIWGCLVFDTGES